MLSRSIFDFEADVFMCEKLFANSAKTYWNLRLLSKGKLIEAKTPYQLEFDFCNDDSCHFTALWDAKKKSAMVINARVYHRTHDKEIDNCIPVQLELFE